MQGDYTINYALSLKRVVQPNLGKIATLPSPNSSVKNFFAKGSYSYVAADSLNYPEANDIDILWGDKEGKLWSTKYGSGDQMGSSLKIISMDEDYDPGAVAGY
jgi:hypothetical protein